MNYFKIFATFSVLFFLFISCESGNKDVPECITAFDCEDGWLCLESKCVDPNAGVSDEDSVNVLPDDGIESDHDTVVEDVDSFKDADVTEDVDMIDDFDDVVPDTQHDFDTVADNEAEQEVDEDIVDDDIIIPFCGNGIPEEGEECDLGTALNTGSYGGCKSDCTLAIRCGDSVKNGAEMCDSGENNGLYGFCKADCSGPGERCGDGTKNGTEECDDGINNGKYGYCNSFCTALGVRCGDGFVNGTLGVEECDDGVDNGVVTACVYGLMSCKVCGTDCKKKDGTVEYCGDGTKNGPEDCDSGVHNGEYGYCKSDCSGLNSCGDSIVTSPEVCDKNTIACNAISGMGYNNAATVDCNGTCDGWVTTACTCSAGYEKDGTEKCVDINECTVPSHDCVTNSTCTNTVGSFTCACNNYYTGDGKVGCTFCKVPSSCGSSCMQCPGGAPFCRDNGNSTSQCVQCMNNTDCGIGYECSSEGACVDTDECTLGTDGCQQNCHNISGSYYCSCDLNYTLNGNNHTCTPDTRSGQACASLPTNASWNTATNITQTWSGTQWLPVTAGVHSETVSTTECHFKCNENYGWNGSSCVADGRTATCPEKPSNTDWNDGGKNGTYLQTWNGSIWTPVNSTSYNTAAGDCRYTCSSGYHWGGSACVWNTKLDQACTVLPSNTVYNTVSSITQTWSSGSWLPTTTTAYNSEASTTECRYKCADGYHREGSACLLDTKTGQGCSAKPVNTDWNTVSSIDQTWNGTTWTPTTTSSYNESSSTTNCYYKCSTGYHREGSACVSNTRVESCTGLPSNASWNTVSSIDQNWSGSAWSPTTAGTYNTTGSTTECRYQCKTNYTWNSGTSTCVADTRSANCDSKPVNTDWNDSGKSGTYTQTWNGTSWLPKTLTTYNTSAGDCRYICSSSYHREGSTCVSNSRTNQSCTAIPANAVWNTVSSIDQTWDGSTWVPTTTSSYSALSSTTECYYKCSSGYHSEGSSCISNTRVQSCTGLPSNASWNTASSITQNWSGSWSPSIDGTYNTVGSTTECRYQCSAGFTWDGTFCVGACPSNVSLGTWASGNDNWSIDDNYWLRSSGFMHLDYLPKHSSSYTKELTYTIDTDLSGCSSATLKFAVQLSDDTSAYGSDKSEKLFVQCYNSGGGWTTMTPNPWPTNQESNCSSTGGYCAGGSGKDWSFGKTNQTISIPAGCRISQAKFRFQATGDTTWSLFYQGWQIYPVTIN